MHSAPTSVQNGERAPLDSVVSEELPHRRSRRADYEAENRVLRELLEEWAGGSERLPQLLVDAVRKLCRAQAAGLLLLEQGDEGPVIRRRAVSGLATNLVGTTVSVESSPASAALELGTPLLLCHPERRYPDVAAAEMLVVPLQGGGEPVGALWAALENDRTQFDREDLRLLTSLATLASATFQAEASRDRRAVEASARLAAIVNSSDDAIVGKTLEGIITSWNRGAEKIFGYMAEEAIGRHISLIVPGDRLAEEADVLRRLREGKAIQHFETERQAKDGRRIRISLSVSPIRDASGRIIGAAKVARDITERNLAEEEFRQAQKLESIGVLAGGIAHDFNNLLTGILGNASLALDSLPPDHEVRELLINVVHASQSAADLTRQMLAYAGKAMFTLRSVDLSELVREVCGLVQSAIPRSVELRLELDGHLPLVEADAAQMQQLLMNLVINGAEAIGEGKTGTVRVTTSTQYVDDERQPDLRPGRYVVLQVQDTGCGMDEETRLRIFDPFFTTKFMGRGLGLAAALGIVRGHKGAIRVSSAPGAGSTFHVLFPAVEEPETHTTQTRALLPPARTSKGTILVVDDEEIVRRTAEMTLKHYGYSVLLAVNGQDAMEIFRAHPDLISMVLLDLTMPVMSGEETLERLQSIRADIPVVLSSGYNEVEAVRRFQHKNLAGFIQKPYTSADLAAKVQTVLAV